MNLRLANWTMRGMLATVLAASLTTDASACSLWDLWSHRISLKPWCYCHCFCRHYSYQHYGPVGYGFGVSGYPVAGYYAGYAPVTWGGGPANCPPHSSAPAAPRQSPPPVDEPSVTPSSPNVEERDVQGEESRSAARENHHLSGPEIRMVGQFNDPARMDEAAAKNGAMHYYLLALEYRRRGEFAAAEDLLQSAIGAERRQPIARWGRLMERVQGRDRMWIERARSEAGVAGRVRENW